MVFDDAQSIKKDGSGGGSGGSMISSSAALQSNSAPSPVVKKDINEEFF